MPLNAFSQFLTVRGTVVSVAADKPSFTLKARSGDLIEAFVGPETYYEVVTNLDGMISTSPRSPSWKRRRP